MKFLQSLKEFLLNVLFPPRCVSCKREGDFLCPECLKGLDKKKISPRYREKTEEEPEFQQMDGVIYALDYAKNPQIKAAIKQLKYRFTQELADYFGALIAEKLEELGMAKNRPIVLIPVPLHKKRLNYRGFNQSEIIAKAIVAHFSPGKIEMLDLLERTRHTSQQAKLDKKARQANLEDAFIMNKKIVHKYSPENLYFLTDDVCTTGATLENCASVLKRNGFEKVYGLVIARAFK